MIPSFKNGFADKSMKFKPRTYRVSKKALYTLSASVALLCLAMFAAGLVAAVTTAPITKLDWRDIVYGTPTVDSMCVGALTEDGPYCYCLTATSTVPVDNGGRYHFLKNNHPTPIPVLDAIGAQLEYSAPCNRASPYWRWIEHNMLPAMVNARGNWTVATLWPLESRPLYWAPLVDSPSATGHGIIQIADYPQRKSVGRVPVETPCTLPFINGFRHGQAYMRVQRPLDVAPIDNPPGIFFAWCKQ
jgi:hypothetical protein